MNTDSGYSFSRVAYRIIIIQPLKGFELLNYMDTDCFGKNLAMT